MTRPRGPLPLRRKLLFALIPVAALYLAAEVVSGWLYTRGTLDPYSAWIIEHRDQPALRFDPISGYRVARGGPRLACVASNGVVESVGRLRRNAQGFPDAEDFTPARRDRRRRFLVLGDSFTAGLYLPRSWPDAAEAATRRDRRPLELLNMSLDGAGLVNWWSILARLVVPGGYDLDGIVFAAYEHDFHRGFAIADDRLVWTDGEGARHMAFAEVAVASLDQLPATFEAAARFLQPVDHWLLLPTAELDAVLRGERSLPARTSGAVFYLARRALRGLQRLGVLAAGGGWRARPGPDLVGRGVVRFDPPALGMMRRLGALLARERIPALVVRIPTRGELLHGKAAGLQPLAFAQVIGARHVDGSRAFRGLSRDRIARLWLPYDGHWGVGASDRFGRFVAGLLRRWPR